MSLLERGLKTPSDDALESMGEVLGFTPAFFLLPPEPISRPAFRCLRSVRKPAVDRAAAHCTLLRQLCEFLEEHVDFPAVTDAAREGVTPEEAAEQCRLDWGLGADRPIGHLPRVLENAGIIIVSSRLPERVDAFSLAGSRPVALTPTASDSATRVRSSLSHECGHLLMHRGRAGEGDHSKELEEQAWEFGGAFLLPARSFAHEFPRTSWVDESWWEELLDIKAHWRVSLASIIVRARRLGLIGASTYRQAFVDLRHRGWTESEPNEPELDEGELLQTTVAVLEREFSIDAAGIASSLRWSIDTLRDVTGLEIPDAEGGEVVAFRPRIG